MRKRYQIAIAALFVGTVGVVAWLVPSPREQEPVYKGKALRVWLMEYDLNSHAEGGQMATGRGQSLGIKLGAEAAVRHLGTNAIPALLNMLRKKDSAPKSWLIRVWERRMFCPRTAWLPTRVRFPSWIQYCAPNQNLLAAQGFEILGAEAQHAVRALTNLYERNLSRDSQDAISRAAISRALIAIGPEAERMAIPSLLRCAASSDISARLDAVMALSQMQAKPPVVVPAMVKSLSDTAMPVRCAAARCLGDFSMEARQAVPALVLLLGDPKVFVRRAATNALKLIDPQAAAEAGVK